MLLIWMICAMVTAAAAGTESFSDSTFRMIGYATTGAGTTGGSGGSMDTIDNLSDLEAWALTREKSSHPEMIYIKGKISSPASKIITIKHGENISILGIDSTSELEHVGLFIWDYKNVIVQNLKIHEVLYPDDAISISECQYVWIDHCELYSKIGPGIGIDTYDGLLDIKKGSKNVTVSWCYLHDHMKVCLIGHTDNETQGLIDSSMRITMHHNYFSHTNGRNPSLRFGAVHYFNNYCEFIDDYAVAIRKRAHALIENNYFHDVRLPVATDKFDSDTADQGFACLSGNIYSGSCSESSNSITRTDCKFWDALPYSYVLEDASTLAGRVIKYSGVGKLSIEVTDPVDTNTTSNRSVNDDAKIRLSVFPNPVHNGFMLSVFSPAAEMAEIQILDFSGKLLREMNRVPVQRGETQIQIGTAGFEPGMYLLVVTGKGFRLACKVIIQ